LKTLKVTASIKLKEKNPDAIFFEPFSKRIFTFNNSSASATAIDPKTDKIIGRVKLDGDPEASATDLNGKVYVNLEDKSSINVFDPKTLKVLNNWPVAPCESPSGLAIDKKNKRLFTVGRNSLMAILDAETGKLITTLPIGNRVDGCAFDESTGLAFSSNGDG
jgi:DNA-binding beta-propeller fold protein YncE